MSFAQITCCLLLAPTPSRRQQRGRVDIDYYYTDTLYALYWNAAVTVFIHSLFSDRLMFVCPLFSADLLLKTKDYKVSHVTREAVLSSKRKRRMKE